MAGIIVPIVEKRIFEFSFLGSTATQDVVLHPALDVGAWFRVRLVVLVHQYSVASGSFSVLAQHTFPSELDRQEFVVSSTGDEFIDYPITATPNLQSASATDPQGYLKILLRADQTTTGGDALYGEFSVYAILRDV